MKILLTGTHFTTAAAAISEFKKFPKVKLVYVGRSSTQEGDKTQSVESAELPKMGVKFIPIIAGRFRRTFDIYTILSLFKIPIGFIQSLSIILKEKPDVILSFGGYVSVPMVFWGYLFSIPIIVHEQTLVSGLANKIAGFFADKIAVSFESDYKFNREKVVLTGNPIRPEILASKQSSKRSLLPTILVTGGNQGSHVLNLAVEEALEELTKKAFVIHQTGDSKFKDFEKLSSLQNERYTVKKFISDDFGDVLSKVDLVIGRAGINTLLELAYLGIPTLVIPVPYIYQDEQTKNAKFFEKLELVNILPQSRLSGKTLFEEVKVMLKDLNKLKINAKEAKKVIIPDAAKRLVAETLILAR